MSGSRAIAATVVLALAGCATAPAPARSAPHLVLAEEMPATSATATSPTDPPSAHHDRQMNRVWGWTAVSVGADAAVLAIVTSGMMLHEASVRSSDCNPQKACSSEGFAANGKLNALAPWNAASWAVAAVGLGVGVFLLLTNPTDKALGTQVEVGAGPTGSGGGLLLRAGF